MRLTDVNRPLIPHWTLEILHIMCYTIAHAPYFIRDCAKHPHRTYLALVQFLSWCFSVVLPGLCRDIAAELRATARQQYWNSYIRTVDAGTVRRHRNRRALTPMGLRTPTQMQCSFLSTLPAEVRTQIYEMYYHDRNLLFVRVRRQWRVRATVLTLLSSSRQEADLSHEGLLDLSLTCRQIYSETINLLYACNTFCFAQPGQISPFLKHIPPRRWTAITSIAYDERRFTEILQAECPDACLTRLRTSPEPRQWLQFWGTVSTLPRLERVVITNVFFYRDWQLLPALLQVTKPLKIFEVHLMEIQALVDSQDVDLEQVQFKLVLPDGTNFLGTQYLDCAGKAESVGTIRYAGEFGGIMSASHTG
ncbi:hypothetical protein Slin15195_G104490 [Septoria linicola]|uniref:DUF7730 domain-containing protein n=1 Tax=Septoria linicola TaxID=215465 RepID=A0A9Q9B2S0_9PEZI|nr:hypothetical protein Slin14017_G067530 [Septoria linicola]USW57130.1 hypothetical protein Slin15195_G104490 [Septoria linicola]